MFLKFIRGVKTPYRVGIGLAAAALLAVGLYNVPAVHSRLAWRLENLRITLYYFLHPPEDVTFVPGQQSLLTRTMEQAPSSAPSGTPLPVELVTPTPSATALPASVILPDVVYVDQMNRWNYCGPANLTMALEYWGWTGEPGNPLAPRDQIAVVVKPGENDPKKDFIQQSNTDVNVAPFEMVDFVNDHTEFAALYRYGGDLDLLKRLIAAGFPVIVEKGIYEKLPPENTLQWAGHYALTTGYDDAHRVFVWQDSYLTLEEPVGRDKLVSYDDLQENWRAFNYTFIVVYPPEQAEEVYRLLGPWGDPYWAAQHALDVAEREIPTLGGNDMFFAMFNRAVSLVNLEKPQYGPAAAAFDQANAYYNQLSADDDLPVPYRIMWYQTAPYAAYFYSGRYQDVIDLADVNLDPARVHAPRTLEESWLWRARAEYALGDREQAYTDVRKAYYYNHLLKATLEQMQEWGLTP